MPTIVSMRVRPPAQGAQLANESRLGEGGANAHQPPTRGGRGHLVGELNVRSRFPSRGGRLGLFQV